MVRIVNQTTLFEHDGSGVVKVEESFAQLRTEDGNTEFVQISGSEEAFNGKQSNIRALDPIWRVK